MSTPSGKPAAWAHQDALALGIKHLLHDAAPLDSLDVYVERAVQEPRVAYKALTGCITHHLLVKAKRREHRLQLLQLLSRVCEQAIASLGPRNVFVERFKPDVARCVACTCRGASEEDLATVSAMVDNWALLEVFSGGVLQSCYDAVERKGQVGDDSSPGGHAGSRALKKDAPSRVKASWSELSLFAPAEQPQAVDVPGADDRAGAAGEPQASPLQAGRGGEAVRRDDAHVAATLAPPAAAPAVRLLPPLPLERVPTPGGGDDPYGLCR